MMPTLKFLSTWVLAVAGLRDSSAASTLSTSAKEKGFQEPNNMMTLRRHRRPVINVESAAFETTLFSDEGRKPKRVKKHKGTEMQKEMIIQNQLIDEWERLLGRENSLSLSLPPTGPSSPVAPQPSPKPKAPVEPEPPSTPTEDTPKPTPILEPETSVAPTPATVPPTVEPPVAIPPTAEPPVAIPPPAEPPVPTAEPPVAEPPTAEPPVTIPPSGEPPAAMPPVEPPTSTTTDAPVESDTPAPVTLAPSTFATGGGTEAPVSECASRDRAQVILEAIESITPEVDLDVNTPTGFAVDWITNEDPAQLDPCSVDIAQRYALVTLYAATEGESWTNQTGWLSEAPECTWFGIECTDDDQVEFIRLRMNNLAGTLPDELRAFSSLASLDVYSNAITGTIPTVINELTDLTLMDMEENQLTGPAFIDVSSLTKLSSYRVSLNQLTGSIPEDWSESITSSLTELWFARNTLEGNLPGSTLGELTALSSLILYSNGWSGTLPSELGQLTLLEQLQLQNNNFTGTIPDSLFDLTALQDLRMDMNSFTGSLSTRLGDLTELRDLRIGGNQFTGTLPPQLARLSNLGILQVNATRLSGLIRDSFEQFQSLRFADFSRNTFTGPLPSSIFGIPAIEILYFSENALTGSIPSNYGVAPNLRDLYINNNNLIGTVPPIEPGQLAMLTEFLLENNDLTGSMPASICALRGDDPDTDLVALIADCGGVSPQIQCDCCNSCVA